MIFVLRHVWVWAGGVVMWDIFAYQLTHEHVFSWIKFIILGIIGLVFLGVWRLIHWIWTIDTIVKAMVAGMVWPYITLVVSVLGLYYLPVAVMVGWWVFIFGGMIVGVIDFWLRCVVWTKPNAGQGQSMNAPTNNSEFSEARNDP